MIALKFLRDGQIAPFSRVRWPSPAGDEPAPWVQRTSAHRVHACEVVDLPDWIDNELWHVELDGDVQTDYGTLAADRGRLIARVADWNHQTAAELAAACTLRARDAAVAVLGDAHGFEASTLQASTSATELATAAATLASQPGVGDDGARAIGYVGDAARHAVTARTDPSTAPLHAAAAGFIASHAAALAAGDSAAAATERAWQARWLAKRLALAA